MNVFNQIVSFASQRVKLRGVDGLGGHVFCGPHRRFQRLVEKEHPRMNESATYMYTNNEADNELPVWVIFGQDSSITPVAIY